MQAAIILTGCALLVARPALLQLGPPLLMITALFAALLVASLELRPRMARAKLRRTTGLRVVVLVTLVGVAVFGFGRAIGGGAAPVTVSARLLALNSLAAVAEEAFFRRLVYAALVPAGAAAAIGGTAVLFALVHLTTYGAWVLPIDLTAGLVFGWQRWSTNSWSVPAITHVAANVLVVL
ncbi:MAG: CPBP family intramembrane metalloprotease [Actinobacteria bacterium]|nr:CPBP family intramembrane metalloprotease [Actinomycetota bacterium]